MSQGEAGQCLDGLTLLRRHELQQALLSVFYVCKEQQILSSQKKPLTMGLPEHGKSRAPRGEGFGGCGGFETSPFVAGA